MIRCAKAAYKTSIGVPNRGDVVEADLLRRLTGKNNLKRLTCELLLQNVVLEDLPPIRDVVIESVPGVRRSLDCWFVFTHDAGETRIPVNVKTTSTPQDRKNFGVALGPLLAYMTDPSAKIDSLGRSEIDADQIILELISGNRKLVPGRDYWLLEIDIRNGNFLCRSLIARHGVYGTGLALERHQSRDVINYTPCGGVILPKFDIAKALGYALLPKPSASRIKTQILAWNLQQEKATLAGGSI